MDFGGLKDIVKDLTQSADQRAVSKALKFYSKGQLDKAIETLVEARDKSPESTVILLDLSRFLILAHRKPEAADALRTLLRREPRAYNRVQEMIEELRAAHAHVGPLYDAIAEHFVRLDNLGQAFEALQRMPAEDLKAFLPRHKAKWDGLRKSAPDARMAKPSLQSVYYFALASEALRDYEQAGTIYRTVARNNPEEIPRVLGRLEALLAKDFNNAALRVAVGDLLLMSGRQADGLQQLGLACETDARAVPAVRERLETHLTEKGEDPEVRWMLVASLMTARDQVAALQAIEPLVQAGALLDRAVPALETLVPGDATGRARQLLATASVRRGHPQAALETLLQVAEEKGLPAIREALEGLVAAAPDFARPYHLLTDIHLAEGRAAAAVECMRKARSLGPGEESFLIPKAARLLEADPTSAEAHLLVADLQLKSGERERALVVLRHLIRLAPGSAGDAVARFAAVLKDDPGSPRARLGAAEACLELKRHPEALQHLEALASAHPDLSAEFLHAFGLLAEAAPDLQAGTVAALRTLLPRSPLPHAVRFAMGEAAFHGGDPATAASAFREVLHAQPERAVDILAALERFDRNDPNAAEARYLLATLYLERRDHAAALAELRRGGSVNAALLDRVLKKYDELLAAAPDDLEARCGFVEALQIAGQADRVLEIGAEVLRTRDDATTARVSLAMADALRQKGDTDAAVKRYFAAHGRDRGLADEIVRRLREVLAAEGTHALASLALGKVLAAEGRSTEATEALRAACAADPKLQETVVGELQKLLTTAPADPQPGLAILAMLLQARDTRRGIQTISRLLDAHPDLASVLAPQLEQILKDQPQEPFATYELARALQHLKMIPRAAALYLAAFRLDESLAPMAQKRLQECSDSAPTVLDPYVAACAIHAARGKFQAAAEKIQQALLRLPNESERLLPRLEEICRQSRGNAAMQMLLAQAALRAGRHDKALAAFSEAARRDPALLDAAFEGYEVIVQAAPTMAPAYLERARVHAQRLRAEQAIADLDRACRLSPALVPDVLPEIDSLRARFPDLVACVLLQSDLLTAVGKEVEATALLRAEMEKGWGGNERLAILIRMWRQAGARQDEDEARTLLEEAARLAPDANLFLSRVHDSHVAILRATVARLGAATEGVARRSDLETVLRALVDLGDLRQAGALLERHAELLDAAQAARLRADIYLRQGEYPRALEHLRDLGPSRALAFGAAGAGDFALAARTLESMLATEGDRPDLRAALERVYHRLVIHELARGRVRLQGETPLEISGEAAA